MAHLAHYKEAHPLPFVITHWINLIAMICLIVTGFCIHFPFWPDFMGIARGVHIFCGFVLAILSLLVAAGYFTYKLLYWDTFQLGLAPLVIGLFFFSAVQLVFIGVIGEYVGAIWTQVKDRPLAIEEEKINFDVKEERSAQEKTKERH